jgi:hypothetical protein
VNDPLASRSSKKVGSVLDADNRLREIRQSLENLPEPSSAALKTMQSTRAQITGYASPASPEVIREKARGLLQEFDKAVLERGFNAWWRTQRQALRTQHTVRRDPNAYERDTKQAKKVYRDPEPRLEALAEQLRQVTVYDKSQMTPLTKLRSKITQFTLQPYTEEIRERARNLRVDFDEQIGRLGYPRWWETEEHGMRIGHRPTGKAPRNDR